MVWKCTCSFLLNSHLQNISKLCCIIVIENTRIYWTVVLCVCVILQPIYQHGGSWVTSSGYNSPAVLSFVCNSLHMFQFHFRQTFYFKSNLYRILLTLGSIIIRFYTLIVFQLTENQETNLILSINVVHNFFFFQILTTLVQGLSIPVTCKIRLLPDVSFYNLTTKLYRLASHIILVHNQAVTECFLRKCTLFCVYCWNQTSCMTNLN